MNTETITMNKENEMYNCPHCKTLVTLEKREHICKYVRSLNGKMVDSLVLYQPHLPKPNKQSTVPGYLKSFGSKSTNKIFTSNRAKQKHLDKLGIIVF